MLNLDPPPGFQGLHPDKPVTCYVRHLPHWRQDGATYFVTFRLGDSLPQNRLRELEGIRREWERLNPPPRGTAALERLASEITTRVELWLDLGHGSCELQHRHLAEFVSETMQHFDGVRYELDAYVVMPNHVHAIVRPDLPGDCPLETLLGGWKQYSGRKIHLATGSEGNLWQEESYDRIIRDEEHLWRALQYIGRNPEKARLSRESCPLWVRPEWEQLGWTFEWRRRP